MSVYVIPNSLLYAPLTSLMTLISMHAALRWHLCRGRRSQCTLRCFLLLRAALLGAHVQRYVLLGYFGELTLLILHVVPRWQDFLLVYWLDLGEHFVCMVFSLNFLVDYLVPGGLHCLLGDCWAVSVSDIAPSHTIDGILLGASVVV